MIGDILNHSCFIEFQFSDLFLIAIYDRHICGRHDPIQQSVDFFLDAGNLAFSTADDLFGLGTAGLPGAFEHGSDHTHAVLGRLDGFQYFADLAFDFVAWDGFAIRLACLCLAEVIGIELASAFGERGSQRNPTRATDNHAPQCELIADIGALRGFCLAFAPLLNFVEGLKRDERLMMPFEPVDIIAL